MKVKSMSIIKDHTFKSSRKIRVKMLFSVARKKCSRAATLVRKRGECRAEGAERDRPPPMMVAERSERD